jgi:hypothetical protein
MTPKICLICILLALTSCSLKNSSTESDGATNAVNETGLTEVNSNAAGSERVSTDIAFENKESANKTVKTEKDMPKTVRDFFMLLPEKYFAIECCQGDKNEYLKQYLTVEDTKNGYMDGGGDAAQSTFRLALFRRPDGTYLVALNVFGEAQDDYYFLDYRDGKWKDISREIIPEYSKDRMYEIPRQGTTVAVFEKRVIDTDGENNLTERGAKLYDLVWQSGKFIIKK